MRVSNFQPLGPAAYGNEEHSLFRASWSILDTLFVDLSLGWGDITCDDDEDCTNHSEFSRIWFENGFGEDPPCLAYCKPVRKWAVGFGRSFSFRTSAARLGMCLALSADLETFEVLNSMIS